MVLPGALWNALVKKITNNHCPTAIGVKRPSAAQADPTN
jgi:hypothetical protein